MFIFGLPLITSCVQLILLLALFTLDTPKGLFLQLKTENGKAALTKIYTNEDRVNIEMNKIQQVMQRTVLIFNS